MFDSGLPKSMWSHALDVAIHVYDRTPHKSIDFETPIRKFAPHADSHFDGIKRSGCIAYIKITKPNSKFDTRAIKAVLIGYESSGYLLWHPSSRRFLQSRHVKFNEKLVYRDIYRENHLEGNKSIQQSSKEHGEITDWDWLKDIRESESKIESVNKEEDKLESKKRGRPRKNNTKLAQKNNTENQNSGPMTRGKSKRQQESSANEVRIGKSVKDVSFAKYTDVSTELQKEDDELRHILLADIHKDPTSYKDAMFDEDRDHWSRAIKEELESMKLNEVWNIIDRPKSSVNGNKPNIIDSKWVFKKKLESDGAIKHKARLVIRGFKDKNIYDLKETYAPVSRLPIVRSALAILNKYNLYACQMDVKTAFLNGTLEEEVYMEIPDGLEVDEQTRKTKVCKLKRALYGLKISPKKWNKRFREEMLELRLENDLHEPCLFTWRKAGKMAIVVLYVDDMLIISNDRNRLEEIKQRLNRVFEMKDLGEPKHFLGMTIEREKEKGFLKIHQSTYIENILRRFNMQDCKPQNTPMITRQVNNRNKRCKLEEKELMNQTSIEKAVPFREAIGSLMYLANATRPDIAYAVNYLARKQREPTEDDWVQVKRIFRYLKGTACTGLKYSSATDVLEAWSDASFRDCQDSTSTAGYVIKLFGDVVAWRSHKQNYVTLSTCQAEYLAMSDACQELVSLDKSLRYVIGKTLFPVTIWCDNRSAGDCTKMDGSHKLKTFDDKLEDIESILNKREQTGYRPHMAETHGDFVKQCVDGGKITVKWIATKENIADIMTKPLPLEAHNYLSNKITNLESF